MARGLGAGPPRPPAPRAAPVPASPSRTRAPAPLFRVHARRAVPPPPPGRSRAKREGLAGTGAARGAGGRGGPAPSPRAPSPRQSLSYARPSAAFQGPCPEGSTPPPRGGPGQNARDGRGRALPGGQEAGADLPRAPATLGRGKASRTRAPAPLSGSMSGVQCLPPPRAGHGQKARDWRGLARPGGQEAGADLPRAPAPLVPASPSRTRAPVPFSTGNRGSSSGGELEDR